MPKRKAEELEELVPRTPSKSRLSRNLINIKEDTTPTPLPQTTGYRDALSKKVPVTPRHRVIVAGKPLTPCTPRTPSTPSAAHFRNVYTAARKSFTRGADPGQLVGREKERSELQTFITERVTSLKGGALYVSGPPGTGKSAIVNEVRRNLESNSTVPQVYINCMSIKSAADIYTIVAEELKVSESTITTVPREALRSLFCQKKGRVSHLVVLDEIDQLLNLDLSVLYDLFEWAFALHSKLVLIGIANALDLTDRFLPRLKARNLKPNLLPFLPYTAAEVADVLTTRCRALLPEGTTSPEFTPFIHPTAIQLIAKKVAAQTGDLRKSFDIALRSIELIESETKQLMTQKSCVDNETQQRSPSKTPLGENQNLSSPRSPLSKTDMKSPLRRNLDQSQMSSLTPATAPRATPAHVIRVTTAAFGNGFQQRFKALNLQQKAVLCALAALEQGDRTGAESMPSPQTPGRTVAQTTPSKRSRSASSAAPTVRALREAYLTVCRRDNILHAVSVTEFRDIVSNLETASLIVAVDGKQGSLASSTLGKGRGAKGLTTIRGDERRISACIGIKNLEAGIEGVASDILKSILRSVAKA